METPSLHTVRFLVSYDGTDLYGWQIQPQPGRRTGQGDLEKALSQVLKVPVRTVCAGRTDAGVHATGQVVSFQTPKLIPDDAWVPALNSVLPRDIAVWQAEVVDSSFHARHSAISRSYRYTVAMEGPRSPLKSRYASWVEGSLDVATMEEVWTSLLGTHDFVHFSSTGSDPSSPICTVTDARLELAGDTLHFHITADHFLYNMVRRLVGTTLRVGKGQLSVEGFRATWAGIGPKPSGPTAPPHGLILRTVGYPPHFHWKRKSETQMWDPTVPS